MTVKIEHLWNYFNTQYIISKNIGAFRGVVKRHRIELHLLDKEVIRVYTSSEGNNWQELCIIKKSEPPDYAEVIIRKELLKKGFRVTKGFNIV
jgi:hypothetical protein